MNRFNFRQSARRIIFSVPLFSLIGLTHAAADKTLTPLAPLDAGHIVTSIRFSPDGDMLATSARDPFIRLWSADGKLVTKIDTHTFSVTEVAWKPDGKQLASTHCVQRDGAMRMHCVEGSAHLWDMTNKSHLRRLAHVDPHHHHHSSSRMEQKEGKPEAIDPHSHPGAEIRAVAWSRDGRYIALGDASGLLRVQEAASGKTMLEEKAQWGIVALDWSANGLLASAAMDNTVVVWNVQQKKIVKTLKGQSWNVFAVAWHPKLPVLASGAGDRTLVVWDAKADKIVQTLTGFDAAVRAIAWRPDGRYLAAASYTMAHNGGTLWLFDTISWQPVVRGATHAGAHINVVAWDPRGERIATGGDDRLVRLWRFSP